MSIGRKRIYALLATGLALCALLYTACEYYTAFGSDFDEIQARYRGDPPPPIDPRTVLYSVTMKTSGGPGEVSAKPESAIAGTEITISAEENGRFVKWETEPGGVTLSGETDLEATFIMPESDVTITGIFLPLPANTPYLKLSPSPVSFDDVVYNYEQPAAIEVTVINEGTGAATVNGISIGEPDADSFTASDISASSIAKGASVAFTVQPITGLTVGKHTAVIIVNYYDDYKATALVAMEVVKADGLPVEPPEADEDGITSSSIILKVPEETDTGNEGMGKEYAIRIAGETDTLVWQSGLVFAGLKPDTPYYVYARSRESGNYKAGTPIPSDIITTSTRNISLTLDREAIDITYGYAGGEGKVTVTIENLGTGVATVNNIDLKDLVVKDVDVSSLNMNDTFILDGELEPVIGTGEDAFFTIEPKVGLEAGAYSVLLTVTYNSGLKIATIVRMTVNKAIGARVGIPTRSGDPRQTSININTVSILDPNDQQKNAGDIEYAISKIINENPASLDWKAMSVLTFTGLDPATTYYIYARSIERGNYRAGEQSMSAAITTTVIILTLSSPENLSLDTIYGNPAVRQTITITNSGTGDASVNSIWLSGTSGDFTLLDNLNPNIARSGGTANFRLQYNTGLPAGIHTILINVRYDGTFTEVAALKLTIDKRPGANVDRPTESSSTSNSITVNQVNFAITNDEQYDPSIHIEYAISKVLLPSADYGFLAWQPGRTFTGLEPGTPSEPTPYYVYARSIESTNYHAGMPNYSAPPITTGKSDLRLTLPATTTLVYDPSATRVPINITITNYGTSDAAINSITLSGTNAASFIPGTPPATVGRNNGTAVYTVQPAAGLGAGKYAALITVTYDLSYTVSASVNLTIDKAPGLAVAKSELTVNIYATKGRSITVNPVSARANSQTIEYAIIQDDNNANPANLKWQPGLTFSGLQPNTDYCVYARSAGNANYLAGTYTIIETYMDANNVEKTIHTEPGGNGSVGTPYLIWDETDLRAVGRGGTGQYTGDSPYTLWTLNRNYKQMDFITITGGYWTPIGTYSPSAPFTGSFDGNNKSIRGIIINASASNYQAMFAYISGSTSTVKDLALADVIIRGNQYTAGIAGYNYGGTIQNCSVSGVITGDGYVGGIMGYSEGGTTVQNCYVTANVTGSTNVGGIAGRINYDTVQYCYTTGNISSSSPSNGAFGGIVGSSESGSSVQNCYTTGNVSSSTGATGGVVGRNYGILESCYATGNVTGNTAYVGGVVGWELGTITSRNNVALNGRVQGGTTDTGRVAGNDRYSLSNNYARSGMTLVGGTVTAGAATKDGANIPEAAYNTKNWWTITAVWNPANAWDFNTVWYWDEVNNLPKLRNVGGQ
jgi:hypothetical protein